MNLVIRNVSAVFACLVFAAASQAATGGITGASASATQVRVGDTVDFSVSFALSTNSWSNGGSNPTEPAPQEGFQEWNVNWYNWESETLTNVSLQSGGASFSDSPMLAPGESYGGNWSFSLTMDQPGTYHMDIGGSWTSTVSYGYSSESASRNCYSGGDDGSALVCDSWYWQYTDGNDWYTNSGDMGHAGFSIEVSAVPEPAAWATLLTGGTLLALRNRRRSRAA